MKYASFAKILGYDVAAMNTSLLLGYQYEYQACLVNSDRYRSPDGYILCPDNAWETGKAIVDNNENLFVRARAAATRCGDIMLAAPHLKFIAFEKVSLLGYMKEIESLPGKEDFLDICLQRYSKVKSFRQASYGL